MARKEKCTWLDLVAHDHLADVQFVEADKYDEYMHFFHDEPLTDEEKPVRV